MGISRRGILGVLAVGGAGAGVSTGVINIDLDAVTGAVSTATSQRSVGDTVERDGIEVTLASYETVRSFEIVVSNGQNRVLNAPDNADCVCVELRVGNNDIESRDLPRFQPGAYQDMEKTEDIDTGDNDIALYGDGDIGSAPDFGILSYGAREFVIDGDIVPAYPLRPRSIKADKEFTGWVPGLVPKEADRRVLRVDIADQSFRWQL